MFATLKRRWEAEESALGKKLKYYGGYIGIGTAWVTLHIPDITSIFTNAGVAIPIWLPKFFLWCGIITYTAGKLTTKTAPTAQP